ncbi:MAG: LacI family DNA-binding transcriptional regulator [Caldilineales bacterium]
MTVQRPARRATITDVARLAGVSIATVSRVLNGTAPVADDTVQLVQQAIEELNYTPHAAARSLAGRSTGTIGLLLPRLSGAFYPPLIRGLETGAKEYGFDLLIHASVYVPEDGRRRPVPLDERNTDGLLVFTDRLDDAEITRLYEQGFPLVLLYRAAPAGLKIPSVTVENKRGARSLVEHLITVHGFRRIAYLAGPDGNEDSYWRELGYREALAEHGIAFDPDMVGCGEFDDVRARAVVEEWLHRGLRFDAIFAGDDEAASGCIMALRQAGKQVPVDVAVVGFDDVPFARLMAPSLTTVRAPIETVGEVAVHQLITLIQGGEPVPFTLLPTELVIRQSCGCR